ncbi:hypothetical protein MMC26_005772 [Xylographa opegraphella]|nr:hypothetical protein [Xylographa opegraphella]
MTTYITRSPLQLLTNTHMMSDSRRSTRRTSARLADKEDTTVTNGLQHVVEKAKAGRPSGTSAKQAKLEVNGKETGPSSVRGKRKPDYDEEDDGFLFTRTRSKRSKATPAVQLPEPVLEEVREDAQRPAVSKRSRKKSVEASNTALVAEVPNEVKRRRSPRNSGDSNTIEPPPLEVKKKRPKQREVEKPKIHDEADTRTAPVENSHSDKLDTVGSSEPPLRHPDRSKDVTKIALPFADTPIIRRNKEMRKGAGDGNRRSSLGMRGRRASSLIDGGKSNALPHSEVESSEFYKHVESGLPEPRRMRQLLTWCGTRALGEKPSFAAEDSHAKLAAREIQQQLLKDFSTRSEMSDWFDRDTAPNPQPPKPNPKNLANLAKIQELEQQIERLQSERKTWETLLAPTTSPLLDSFTSDSLPPISTISAELLSSPTQAAALEALRSYHALDAPLLADSTKARLQDLSRDLEFKVDTFAENVHVLGQYREEADRMAERALQTSAQVLEEREKKRAERSGEDIGVREVLRGLSRVVDR